MTFYVKRPGQDKGDPVGEKSEYDFGSITDASLDDWALYLPHQCDAWEIAYGDRDAALTEAKKFRAELDRAIELLEQDGD